MSPYLIILGLQFMTLTGRGDRSLNSQIRKIDAQLSLLSSKLETMQTEITIHKYNFQEEVLELKEQLKQVKENSANVKECSNKSSGCQFKMVGILSGDPCPCNDVSKLRNVLENIGEKDTNISQVIMALENIDKQQRQIDHVSKIIFESQKIEAAMRGFGKEKIARRKLETEMDMKFFDIDSKFSNISDECRSQQLKFKDVIITQQRMDQSLRALSAHKDEIQKALSTLGTRDAKLFMTSDQLNGSLNYLFFEVNDMKSSLSVLQRTQEELSLKSDATSRLLEQISSQRTENRGMTSKHEQDGHIPLFDILGKHLKHEQGWFAGKLFVVGGFDGHACLNSAEAYDPQNDQWTLLSPMSTRRSGVNLVCFQGQMYAVGGYDGSNRLNTVEMYDPWKEIWYSAPSMNVGRSNFASVVMDDGLYVMGGYDGDKTSDVAECYNSETKTWIYKKNLHIGRSAVSACSIKYIPNAKHFSFHGNCRSISIVANRMITGSRLQQYAMGMITTQSPSNN